jgi:hypothetical protein
MQRERLRRRELGPHVGQSLLEEVLEREINTYAEHDASLSVPA